MNRAYKTLYRSRTNRMIGGVAAGLGGIPGDRPDRSPAVVRAGRHCWLGSSGSGNLPGDDVRGSGRADCHDHHHSRRAATTPAASQPEPALDFQVFELASEEQPSEPM